MTLIVHTTQFMTWQRTLAVTNRDIRAHSEDKRNIEI